MGAQAIRSSSSWGRSSRADSSRLLPSVTGTRFREPSPAAALLAGLAAAALLADRTIPSRGRRLGAVLGLRGFTGRGWPTRLVSGLVLFLFSPLVARYGGVVYWEGPEVPVIGQLDVTSEEAGRSSRADRRPSGPRSPPYALLPDLDGLLLAVWEVAPLGLAVARDPAAPRRSSETPPATSRRFGAAGLSLKACAAAHGSSSPARRLARAFAEPRRVDGGPWLRTARQDAGPVSPWSTLDRL